MMPPPAPALPPPTPALPPPAPVPPLPAPVPPPVPAPAPPSPARQRSRTPSDLLSLPEEEGTAAEEAREPEEEGGAAEQAREPAAAAARSPRHAQPAADANAPAGEDADGALRARVAAKARDNPSPTLAGAAAQRARGAVTVRSAQVGRAYAAAAAGADVAGFMRQLGYAAPPSRGPGDGPAALLRRALRATHPDKHRHAAREARALAGATHAQLQARRPPRRRPRAARLRAR